MTRKTLTPDAMKIADMVRARSATVTDVAVAQFIGVDPSTICRWKVDHLEQFCAYLDFLGFKIVPKETCCIDAEKLNSLKTLAKLGVDLVGQ